MHHNGIAGQSSMSPPSQAGRVVLVGWLALSALAVPWAIVAQEPMPPSPAAPTTQPQSACVQELGGRLVVCGEAVEVRGNPDEPIRDSSLATKVETPLLETPRSISVIDQRTLDDMGAVNITQAHD